jgi:hypothetical protein
MEMLRGRPKAPGDYGFYPDTPLRRNHEWELVHVEDGTSYGGDCLYGRGCLALPVDDWPSGLWYGPIEFPDVEQIHNARMRAK